MQRDEEEEEDDDDDEDTRPKANERAEQRGQWLFTLHSNAVYPELSRRGEGGGCRRRDDRQGATWRLGLSNVEWASGCACLPPTTATSSSSSSALRPLGSQPVLTDSRWRAHYGQRRVCVCAYTSVYRAAHRRTSVCACVRGDVVPASFILHVAALNE